MRTRIIQTDPEPSGSDAAPPAQKHNIAARMARWSAQHRRKAILGWLAFVIAAVAIGGAIGTKTLETYELGFGDPHGVSAAVGTK